jgi:hypothetical protein
LRLLGVHPGKVQGVLEQLLHVVDLALQAFTQVCRRQVAVMGDAQARQWRAQLVGQRAQQQALLLQALAQAPGHVLEGLCQFAQLVAALLQGQARAFQVVGAQGHRRGRAGG